MCVAFEEEYSYDVYSLTLADALLEKSSPDASQGSHFSPFRLK